MTFVKATDPATTRKKPASIATTTNDTSSQQPQQQPHWTEAAARGTLATVLFKILSFVCTQWTFRVLDNDIATLGRASIQLELLLTTVLFLSREGFRLALTQTVSSENDSVIWLSIPTGTLLSLVALWFHLGMRSSPTDDNDKEDDQDFRLAGILYCLACWIEMLGEPAALYALRTMNVTWKVTAESMATVGKTVATVVFLQYLPAWPVTSFGLAQVVYAGICCTTLYLKTWKRLPRLCWTLEKKSCYLTLILTLQGCFKHFLTEGDRIVLSTLADSYNQGVYAMGSSYGGLAARILFQPIEENCRLLWSRLVQESQTSPSAIRKLETSYCVVIKSVLYVGFVFCFLAVNFTELLLNLLAGRKWGNNVEAVAVLSAFCVYTAFLAWNGTTEAFVYACASSGQDVGRLGLVHTLVGVIFAVAAPLAVGRFGAVGLVAVNCLTMLLRSLYSLYFAAQFFSKLDPKQGVARYLLVLLRHMFPHPIVVATFLLSYMATFYSRKSLQETASTMGLGVGSASWFKLSLQHIGVGVSCGLALLSMAFYLEVEYRKGVQQMLRKSEKED